MAPSRMTANPVKPARYRPGKGPEEASSESESSDDEQGSSQAKTDGSKPKVAPNQQPPDSVASGVRQLTLTQRRAQAAASEAARLEAEKAALGIREDDFETEDESDDTGDERARPTTTESGQRSSASSSEADSSSEEDSESSDESETPAKPLLRPTFIRKGQRPSGETSAADEATKAAIAAAEHERRRKEAATALVQEQLEKNAAARAAERKAWDDDEEDPSGVATADAIDDTDGVEPEAEHAAWRLRELKRVQRARQAIEDAEKEREEVERRRALSPSARAAEDEAFVAAQREERENRGKAGFMQRYHHRGAFFQDEAQEDGLDRRDLMGARFVDDAGGSAAAGGKETLPEYMQIRDMAKLGRKGRTKYKDLRHEDTGRWGTLNDHRPRKDGFEVYTTDERYQPDRDGRSYARAGEREGPSGANAISVKVRRGTSRSPQRRDEEPRSRPKARQSTSPESRSPSRTRRRSESRSRTRSPRRRRRPPSSSSPSPPRHRKRSISTDRHRDRSRDEFERRRNGDKRQRVR